jgi:hypothetical protein
MDILSAVVVMVQFNQFNQINQINQIKFGFFGIFLKKNEKVFGNISALLDTVVTRIVCVCVSLVGQNANVGTALLFLGPAASFGSEHNKVEPNSNCLSTQTGIVVVVRHLGHEFSSHLAKPRARRTFVKGSYIRKVVAKANTTLFIVIGPS